MQSFKGIVPYFSYLSFLIVFLFLVSALNDKIDMSVSLKVFLISFYLLSYILIFFYINFISHSSNVIHSVLSSIISCSYVCLIFTLCAPFVVCLMISSLQHVWGTSLQNLKFCFHHFLSPPKFHINTSRLKPPLSSKTLSVYPLKFF